MMKMKQTKPVNALAIGKYRPPVALPERGTTLPEGVVYWFPWTPESQGGEGLVTSVFPFAK